MRERSVCIIIDDSLSSVLLMHRIKDGREYFTLPGGKIEPGETPQAACQREAQEETGLVVAVGQKVRVLFNLGRVEYYFAAASYQGTVALGGPEREHNAPDNFYEPLWMPISQLGEINFLPKEAVEMVRSLI